MWIKSKAGHTYNLDHTSALMLDRGYISTENGGSRPAEKEEPGWSVCAVLPDKNHDLIARCTFAEAQEALRKIDLALARQKPFLDLEIKETDFQAVVL